MQVKNWLMLGRKKSAQTADEQALRQNLAAFSQQYRQIREACVMLETAANLKASCLAAAYMTHALHQTDLAWWRENGVYCTQSWFIWEYCLRQGIVHAPSDPPSPWEKELVIRPENETVRTCVRMRLRRDAQESSQGALLLKIFGEPLPGELLRSCGFRVEEKYIVRRVGERSAPLMDRAVECAGRFLENGCAVSVVEPALKQQILEQRFEAEHRYWVLAGKLADQLYFMYPYNEQLNRYLYAAGGQWNGKCMVISVTNAEKMEELIHLYGFRVTKEARRRIEAWNMAMEQASIYRIRKGKTRRNLETCEDMFQRFLKRKIEVPEDLRDSDE